MKLKEYKRIIIPIAIIALGLVLALFISLTQIKAVKNLTVSVDQLEADKEELRAKYLMLSSLDEGDIQRQSALAELAVPSEKNIPFILQSFRNAVESANFVISDFKFMPGELTREEISELEEKNGVEKLPLSASIIGPADNLENLIDAFETTFPLFDLRAVEFKRNVDQENKARIKLELFTFYCPPLAKRQFTEISLDELVLTDKESSLLEEISAFSRPELKRRESRGLERKSDNPFVF